MRNWQAKLALRMTGTASPRTRTASLAFSDRRAWPGWVLWPFQCLSCTDLLDRSSTRRHLAKKAKAPDLLCTLETLLINKSVICPPCSGFLLLRMYHMSALHWSNFRKIAEKLWGGILPKRFFPLYLLLVMVAGHFTNEYFARHLEIGSLEFTHALVDFRHMNNEFNVAKFEETPWSWWSRKTYIYTPKLVWA